MVAFGREKRRKRQINKEKTAKRKIFRKKIPINLAGRK